MKGFLFGFKDGSITFVLGMMFTLSLLFTAEVHGQEPEGYYDSAEGKNKGDLLEALELIVGPHYVLDYGDLWQVYKTSDVTSEGYIWDMYSTSKFDPDGDRCGNYNYVGDCFNREHSMPKSWFDDRSPMYTDAFHLYPTDGRVNGQRSNYPFGECSGGSTLPSHGGVQALGRLGKSTFPGYDGTVFEPDDRYKGDFARTYFYMAAAYNSKISSWSSDQLAGNSYPCFSSWSVDLLMKWHREDPVSQKEIDRNNVIYGYQHNRNPFIDHPELAEYIWGNNVDEGWSPNGDTAPVLATPVDGEVYNLGITSIGRNISLAIEIKGDNLSENLSVSLSGSTKFKIDKNSISAQSVCDGTVLNVDYSSTEAGSDEAVISLSSSEVAASITVQGMTVDGVPALPATNVTSDSFTANWIYIGEADKYTLSVYYADGGIMLNGYPVDVDAESGHYSVTGLEYDMDYCYTLTHDGKVSNVIEVTTADVEHVLEFILPSDGLKFSAIPNEPSAEAQVGVYTEYITEPVAVSVTGNFELSLDKSTWGNSVEIDPSGENFYIRMKAMELEGDYSGILSMKSGMYESTEIDVYGTVAALRTFLEDFEWENEHSSYNTGVEQGNACEWKLSGVAIIGSGQDNPHGELCARLGKNGNSAIEMAEDKHNGAGTLSFYAGSFGNDEDCSLEVSYSVDSGENWTLINTVVLTSGVLKEYVFPLNIAGDVRLRFVQKGGKRANIDDISLTNYVSSVQGVVSQQGWDAYAIGNGRLAIEAQKETYIEIYSINAIKVFDAVVIGNKNVGGLGKGIYIVVSGNDAKKVVVK